MILSTPVKALLSARMGRNILHAADCEFLALDIETHLGERLGVNTLKRLLGFIPDEREPRITTLDIIARYLGYDDWKAVQRWEQHRSNSAFDNHDELSTASLPEGTEIEITYQPDRLLTIRHHSGEWYEVVHSRNSKLIEGDRISLSHLVRHYPLFIGEVIRTGRNLGAFTAGKEEGIDYRVL